MIGSREFGWRLMSRISVEVDDQKDSKLIYFSTSYEHEETNLSYTPNLPELPSLKPTCAIFIYDGEVVWEESQARRCCLIGPSHFQTRLANAFLLVDRTNYDVRHRKEQCQPEKWTPRFSIISLP
jgi:hypothetical protein